MGIQNEHRYLEVPARAWPAGVKSQSLSTPVQGASDVGRLSLPREFAELVVACAKALRATHVVTSAGWVVHDCSAARSGELAHAQLVVEGEYIHATEPELERALQAALSRSAIDDVQCIGQPNFDSLITLKRVDFGSTHLIFIRSDSSVTLTDRELLPLTKAFNLTRTESTVLRHLSGGLSPEMVAERLDVAISTVRSHIKNLLEKTSCQDLRRLLIHVCRAVG